MLRREERDSESAFVSYALDERPEGEGTTLLDHTAMVMTHEGGYGWDAADGVGERSHSTERMACLVAGRAGGVVSGQHILASELEERFESPS